MAISKEELIEEIKNMSVLDLADVVKALEEEFGVSAAAPVAVAAAPAAGGASGKDFYTLNIIKTADATFTVLANVSNFA